MKKNLNKNTFAIVTGASKGLGFAYCEELLKLGYNVIGVARNTESLKELQEKYKNLKVERWDLDLSDLKNSYKLFEDSKKINVEIIINNAGYGVWGYFDETDLEKEMNMIDLNIKSLHIITKLFATKFKEENKGRVINIASMGSFTPGPVFSSYYASKAYVLSLGIAVNTELKKTKSKARVITVCPGALKTDFWNRSSTKERATLREKSSSMSPLIYAKKSLKKAIKVKRKNYLVVGAFNKFAKMLTDIMPEETILNSVYKYQRKTK
ncbi:SDR family NAD(P)-dependent oxidoreductase [Spiroplasma monobiae]|uniref:Short-chain dehydrogenase/reductase SDR n=1 Tax=Spiroplasma monobiae MQ-1 TaxID=1336748 RepID=A0A2K9LV67_SPISQ|nr:SDR family NAD(P)-dependent oxidoreductase [Spiroplasma monobiae]AUM62937.1 short-chain dehydrogenase/reductase SDR [Spiroplasma monobiae MQ-1]